jgi:hypothetical protein
VVLQVIQDRPMSQPERLDHRQHPFREVASRLAVATECVLPPEHPALLAACGDDADGLRRIAEGFRDDVPSQLAEAGDALRT